MKGLKHRSFKFRIFATIMMVSLVPILVCNVFLMLILVNRSEAQVSRHARLQLEQTKDKLGTVFLAFSEISNKISESGSVRDELAVTSSDSNLIYNELYEIIGRYYEYARFNIYDAGGICRYAVNGSVPSEKPVTNWGVIRRAASDPGMLVFSAAEGDASVTAAKVIVSGGQPIGYIEILMSWNNLNALLSDDSDSVSNIMLLNAHWRLIYHPQASQGEPVASELRRRMLSGEPLTVNEDTFIYYVSRDDVSGFYLVLQQPKTFTSGVMTTFYLTSGIMGFLCLLLCLFGAWTISRHLSRPVRDLSDAMGKVESGDFDIRLEPVRDDELGKLTNSFNRMVEEYRMNLNRSVGRQKELNSTQIRMMRAQLNPHFLYNTLDSMRWLGSMRNVPEIATLAADLAAILRASISEDEFVILDSELELVERYIDIQSIRFKDRFTCEITVSEQYRNCIVPKLILQPLVENAIMHGIVDMDDGYIKIWAEDSGGELTVHVSDNGCGIPEEVIERLEKSAGRTQEGHLGLFNVNNIIRLHYGDAYGIIASTEKDRGSRVSIRLPLKMKE